MMKRIVSICLSMALVITPISNVFANVANSAENPTNGHIVFVEEYSDDVIHQQIRETDNEECIFFPSTLSATVERVENTIDESLEEFDSENPIDSNSVESVVRDDLLIDVLWELDEGKSTTNTFLCSAGNTYYYRPVLDTDYSVECTLPEICVDICVEDEIEQEFVYSNKISGYYISVIAPAGVFPNDTEVMIEKVQDEENLVMSLLSDESTINQIASFDFTFLHDGIEIEPKDGNVSVSISLDDDMKDSIENLDAQCQVFHIEDNGDIEEINCETDGDNVIFETSSFTKYTVITSVANSFNYNEEPFNIKNGTLLRVTPSYNGIVSIPEGTTAICDRAFLDSEASAIIIPNSITYLDQNCFEGCNNITEITIPDSITHYGSYIFKNCPQLKHVDLPQNMDTLPIGIFKNCGSLEEYIVDNCITTIGEEAFNGCSSLTSIILPNNLKTIDALAFNRCQSLTTIEIPQNVEEIGLQAFGYCGFKKVVIPSGVKKIGTWCFGGCENLEEIYLPKSVTSIGMDILDGCTSLTDVYYEGTREDANKLIPVTFESTLTPSSKHKEDITFHYEYDATDATDDPDTPSVTPPVLSLSANTAWMKPNTSFKLTASVTPEPEDYSIITWSSSDNSIAFVDKDITGKLIPITAKKEGKATVTAALSDGSGISASCEIIVSNKSEENGSIKDDDTPTDSDDSDSSRPTKPTSSSEVIEGYNRSQSISSSNSSSNSESTSNANGIINGSGGSVVAQSQRVATEGVTRFDLINNYKGLPKVMSDGQLFDATYYALLYPDVASNPFYGQSEEYLYLHYKSKGKGEGRYPYKTVTSDLAAYTDAADFLNNLTFTDAFFYNVNQIEHYVKASYEVVIGDEKVSANNIAVKFMNDPQKSKELLAFVIKDLTALNTFSFSNVSKIAKTTKDTASFYEDVYKNAAKEILQNNNEMTTAKNIKSVSALLQDLIGNSEDMMNTMAYYGQCVNLLESLKDAVPKGTSLSKAIDDLEKEYKGLYASGLANTFQTAIEYLGVISGGDTKTALGNISTITGVLTADDKKIAVIKVYENIFTGGAYGSAQYLYTVAMMMCGSDKAVKEIDNVIMSAYLKNSALKSLKKAETLYIQHYTDPKYITQYINAYNVAKSITDVQYVNMLSYYKRNGKNDLANDIQHKLNRLNGV